MNLVKLIVAYKTPFTLLSDGDGSMSYTSKGRP